MTFIKEFIQAFSLKHFFSCQMCCLMHFRLVFISAQLTSYSCICKSLQFTYFHFEKCKVNLCSNSNLTIFSASLGIHVKQMEHNRIKVQSFLLYFNFLLKYIESIHRGTSDFFSKEQQRVFCIWLQW